MNIKNYTSGIAVSTTIARIEEKLAAIGANRITKDYHPQTKEITGVAFLIELGNQQYAFRLPANVEKCFEALWSEHCRSHRKARPKTKERIRYQAQRTAWRIVQEWVEIQVSMVVMQQAEAMEVFLPYLWSEEHNQTFFQMMKGNGFKQLKS